MEIVHIEKDGNFTWMKNIHLRDRFLSLKAKVLLSVMFSLPKDWDCTITGLAYAEEVFPQILYAQANGKGHHQAAGQLAAQPSKGPGAIGTRY